MAAAANYMPKGTPVDVVGYWFPARTAGPVANDTMTVLSGAQNPVLAHLFLNYLHDLPNVLENISFNGYMQPINGVTAQVLVAEGILPQPDLDRGPGVELQTGTWQLELPSRRTRRQQVLADRKPRHRVRERRCRNGPPCTSPGSAAKTSAAKASATRTSATVGQCGRRLVQLHGRARHHLAQVLFLVPFYTCWPSPGAAQRPSSRRPSRSGTRCSGPARTTPRLPRIFGSCLRSRRSSCGRSGTWPSPPLCLLIAYPAAYFVARFAGRRKALFLVLLIAPFWISYMMRMLAWIDLLQSNGYLNKALGRRFACRQPSTGWAASRYTVILGLVYGYIPYLILVLYAGLDRIDERLLEAGRDLGLSRAENLLADDAPAQPPDRSSPAC